MIHNKTELFSRSGNWSTEADHPSGTEYLIVLEPLLKLCETFRQGLGIYEFVIIVFENDFYTFGGTTRSGQSMNTVAQFRTIVKEWKIVGAMKETRSNHGVSFQSGKFFIVGGSTRSERCILNDTMIECTYVDRESSQTHLSYIVMMPVSFDYCSK